MEVFDWEGNPVTRKPDKIVPSVSAILLNSRGELLLQLRTDNNLWSLPGGEINIGESIIIALQREVLEETGLSLTIKKLLGLYSDVSLFTISKYPGGALVHHVNICFICNICGGELRGSEEGYDLRFFPFNDLPSNILLSHKIRIHDASSSTTDVYIK